MIEVIHVIEVQLLAELLDGFHLHPQQGLIVVERESILGAVVVQSIQLSE